VVDEDKVRVEDDALGFEFIGLAAADEVFRVRLLDARIERADDAGACRTRKFAELLELIGVCPERTGVAYPARLQ